MGRAEVGSNVGESNAARRIDRLLVRRRGAWFATIAAVALGQVMMWRGWYASGEWVTPELGGIVLGAAVVAVPSLVVVAGALVLLTRWAALGVFLGAYLGVALWVGSYLSTSSSSTAVFAFAAPPVYPLPLLLVLALVDLGMDWIRRRQARAR